MMKILDYLDDVMYYPILVVVLVIAGLYFTFKTRFLQLRLFKECISVVMEKPEKEGSISSFQALMVSTASRVGTQLFQFVQHRLHIAAAKLYHAAGIWLGYFASALFCAGTDQFFHLLRRAAAKRHKHAEFSRFREKFLPVLVAPLVKIK